MDTTEGARIVGSTMTVADKIRALEAAGYPRAEIARALGKRYQHVRNVLEGDKLRQSPDAAPRTDGVAEPARRFEGAYAAPDIEDRRGGAYRLTVREDGSVVLPPAVREELGVTGGGNVMARLEGEEFKLIGPAEAMRRIHDILRPYRRTEGSLASEELIAERRSGAIWGD